MAKPKLISLLLLIVILCGGPFMLFFINKGNHIYISKDIKIGEEIMINSDKVRISASLLKPKSNNPSPAIIFVNGSGASSYRKHWEKNVKLPLWKSIADKFLNQGYSVLLLEKRGINKSEGNWETESFYDRAKDVNAALQYLKSREDIISDEIGLLGYSQGGWVIQLVGAEHPEEVAFLINIVGPATPVKKQVIYEMETKWLKERKSVKSIKTNKLIWNSVFEFYTGFSKLVKTGYLSRIIDYDPKMIIPKIKAPIFTIYGENDQYIDPHMNRLLLEELLKEGQNNQYKITVIPNANHWFMEAERDATDFELEKISNLHPDFLDTLASFKDWYDQKE
jgi:pimeloyl-ACP methyl ester carboxylesterase